MAENRLTSVESLGNRAGWGLLKRLDAFHIRGIRHILGIEHAYWSRTSNDEILMKANWILENAEDITA